MPARSAAPSRARRAPDPARMGTPSRARRQTLPECQCPMVWDLKQTSVEEEQPERAAMFLIHFVRCSVVSQRKVKA